MLLEVFGHTLEEKINEEFNQIKGIWKGCSWKNVGQMMGQMLLIQQKSLVNQDFFQCFYAPYRDRTCDPRIKSPLLCQLS